MHGSRTDSDHGLSPSSTTNQCTFTVPYHAPSYMPSSPLCFFFYLCPSLSLGDAARTLLTSLSGTTRTYAHLSLCTYALLFSYAICPLCPYVLALSSN
ncbi:hypothetical protein BD626DRAFT_471913, partial [Schizophyllum amplum]